MNLRSPRTLFAWLVMALAAAGAFETLYLQMLHPAGRAQTRATLEAMTDEPGYREFLKEVEARTEKGSSILVVAPRPWGNGQYEYVYYRAAYLVAGRTILPARWNDDRPVRENVQRAHYVAAWGMRVESPAHALVWQGTGGALYRMKEPPR